MPHPPPDRSGFDDLTVYLGDQWIVRQCADIPLPGYLILQPREEYRSVSSLGPKIRESLGGVLVMCVDAVEQVVEPERVYTACFNESGGGIHFHIFPRMRDMGRFGLRDGQVTVDGPLLLSEVRNTLRNSAKSSSTDGQVMDAVQRIRSLLSRSRP